MSVWRWNKNICRNNLYNLYNNNPYQDRHNTRNNNQRNNNNQLQLYDLSAMYNAHRARYQHRLLFNLFDHRGIASHNKTNKTNSNNNNNNNRTITTTSTTSSSSSSNSSGSNEKQSNDRLGTARSKSMDISFLLQLCDESQQQGKRH